MGHWSEIVADVEEKEINCYLSNSLIALLIVALIANGILVH